MVCLRLSLVLVHYRNQNSSGIVNQILDHMEKRDTSHFGDDSREYRHGSPVLAEFSGKGDRISRDGLGDGAIWRWGKPDRVIGRWGDGVTER